MTRPSEPRLAFKARRGALVLFVGLIAVCLVAVGAIAIDMGRLGNLRAELQIAADAGAHAGAVQIVATPGNSGMIVGSARSYAQRNTAMGVVPTIDLAEMGFWDPTTQTFDPASVTPNAVRVQVSVAPQGLIMEIVGVGPPVVHATAIGSTATFPNPPTTRAVLVK